MFIKTAIIVATGALLTGCADKQLEGLATNRCEALLAAQEISSLPEPLRSDPRAPIKPKGDARINAGERIVFVRRAYDRLKVDGAGSRIEPREFICKYDRKAGKVVELSTNGHTQEFRDNDDEWAIKQRSQSSER